MWHHNPNMIKTHYQNSKIHVSTPKVTKQPKLITCEFPFSFSALIKSLVPFFLRRSVSEVYNSDISPKCDLFLMRWGKGNLWAATLSSGKPLRKRTGLCKQFHRIAKLHTISCETHWLGKVLRLGPQKKKVTVNVKWMTDTIKISFLQQTAWEDFETVQSQAWKLQHSSLMNYFCCCCGLTWGLLPHRFFFFLNTMFPLTCRSSHFSSHTIWSMYSKKILLLIPLLVQNHTCIEFKFFRLVEK